MTLENLDFKVVVFAFLRLQIPLEILLKLWIHIFR